MTDILNGKIILYSLDGSELEEFMVVVDKNDVEAAMKAISHAQDIWHEQRYDEDIDCLEDQIADCLRDMQIEFCLPYYKSID